MWLYLIILGLKLKILTCESFAEIPIISIFHLQSMNLLTQESNPKIATDENSNIYLCKKSF